MKTALCISGQPRSVELAYSSIYENIIVPNEADVYIHSWVDDNIKGKKPVAASGFLASDTIPHNIEDVILSLYKPKKYIFEPQIEFDEKNYNDCKLSLIRPKYSLSQRYSVMKSIELATQEDYDVIIRMRFDWKIYDRIEVKNLPLEMVTVPNDAPHRGTLPNGKILFGVNDQFAIGNSIVMKKYGDLYNHIEEIFNMNLFPYADEYMLSYFLEHMSNIKFHKIPIKFMIVRNDNKDMTQYNGLDFIK